MCVSRLKPAWFCVDWILIDEILHNLCHIHTHTHLLPMRLIDFILFAVWTIHTRRTSPWMSRSLLRARGSSWRRFVHAIMRSPIPWCTSIRESSSNMFVRRGGDHIRPILRMTAAKPYCAICYTPGAKYASAKCLFLAVLFAMWYGTKQVTRAAKNMVKIMSEFNIEWKTVYV